MVEKYLVYDDEQCVALKYDAKKKELIVGGNAKFRRMMEGIITDFFGRDVPRVKSTAVNKCKYLLKNIVAIDLEVKEMREQGFVVQSVQRLERMMY